MFSFADWWVVVKDSRQVLVLGQPLADVVAIITVIGLLATLYMTLRILRENARANILNSLPILTLRYSPMAAVGNNDTMTLENIGDGTALNIRIDSFYLSFVDDIFFPKKANHYVLQIEPVDILKPGESEPLDTQKSVVGGLIGPEDMIYKIFSSDKPLTFYLRFQDVSGTDYISKVRISTSDVKVAGRPKRYTLGQKIKYLAYRVTELFYLRIVRHQANRKQAETNKTRNSSE
jgi:hypothetical protein